MKTCGRVQTELQVRLTYTTDVVGIATSYGLEGRGVEVQAPVGSRIFSYPRPPDPLWGPPNLLTNGYPGIFRRR
jgi:hypothetical protein